MVAAGYLMGGGLLASALGSYLGTRGSDYYSGQLEDIARKQREISSALSGRVQDIASGMGPAQGIGQAGTAASRLQQNFRPRPDPYAADIPAARSGYAQSARGAAVGGGAARGAATASSMNRLGSFNDNLAMRDVDNMRALEMIGRDLNYSRGLEALAGSAATASQYTTSAAQDLGGLLSGLGQLLVMYGSTRVDPTARDRLYSAALSADKGRFW